MSVQIAQTPSGPMEYEVDGSGSAVLVLKGGHCTRATRLGHERLASAGFTVVTPSRPGYDSTPAAVGRTAQAAADALAALLGQLGIATTAVIGISAAGPTALALALRHPRLVSHVVLESAVSLPWGAAMQRMAAIPFGRLERFTWGLLHAGLRRWPLPVMRAMLGSLTTLDVGDVLARMGPEELAFVHDMIASMRSGRGFMCDVRHRVDGLEGLACPVLAMYTPHDGSVPLAHAQRVAREAPRAMLYEVQADTHLIWAGPQAPAVWARRLAFLRDAAPEL